jgi:hypothetical protein
MHAKIAKTQKRDSLAQKKKDKLAQENKTRETKK